MKILVKLFIAVCFVTVGFVLFTVKQSASDALVPYPKGYREWIHVKSGIVGKESPTFKRYEGIHHIYANPKAMQGFEKGEFPDGSVIVFDLLEAPVKNGITTEGSRRFIDVMHKDSKKFSKTSGWGFEEFNGDSMIERLLTVESAAKCSACHASQKDHVFSSFRK